MKLLPLVDGVFDAVKNCCSAAVATGNDDIVGDAMCAQIDRSVSNETKKNKK